MADRQEIAEKKLKVGEYWESWHIYICPYCEKRNWVCNGDETDLTGVDVEACNCWSCKELFRLSPEDTIMEEIRGENGIMYETDGKENPDDR